MHFFVKVVVVAAFLHCVVSQDRQIIIFDDEGNSCLTDVDLMLVLDGSKSIGEENFEKVKEWVKNLGRSLQIDQEFVKIGVVQYSYYYPNRKMNQQPYMRTEIVLGDYESLEDFQDSVDRIEHQGYRTDTAHAINKTLYEDFSQFPPNRYPNAMRALILLTDGKADDSDVLADVVDRAEKEFGVNMYAVGIGDYNETELLIITRNDTDRVFTLQNFDELSDIIANLEESVFENCDCSNYGSVDNDCDPCTRLCTCKPNVTGRRCDECEAEHYGIEGGEGCLPCDCHPIGSRNTSCNLETGQCDCINDTVGRRCDKCPPFHFGEFPSCKECDCNGFSTTCDRDTGGCTACEGNRRGYFCERCESGHYVDPETKFCVPCQCNDNIDPHDPFSCDDLTGKCEKCLYDTAGEHCEECQDGFWGNAWNRSCQRCVCTVWGTDFTFCDEAGCCNKVDGQCPCLANVEEISCSKCRPGTWRKRDTGCDDCDCYLTGTQSNTSCDEDTGECKCTTGYTGQKCDECDNGYEITASECSKITTTATATTTTTTTPGYSSTTRKTSLPVNPDWSPCVTCGRVRWPSYCQGWYCRRRWPYHQFYPSSRRCYSWNWGCRTSVEYLWNQYGYQQQLSPQNMDSYYRRPRYYRGYNHHARSRPARYSLYRN